MALSEITNMFTPSSLLAGGVAAAVVAGWSQVKSILSQLSGLLVVTTELDDHAMLTIYSYLRRNWYLLPSGKHKIFTQWVTLKRGDRVGAPFRVNSPHYPSVFVKGRQVVIFRQGGQSMTTFRFVTDFRQIAIEAFREKQPTEVSSAVTRFRGRGFYVSQQFGPVSFSKSRRGAQVSFTSNARGSSEDEAPKASNATDPLLEDSLLYDKSTFSSSSPEDASAGRVFSPEVLDLLNDADMWASQEKWYSERRIPWRRGWTLIGPPGTGKSTVAEQAAKQLNVPLYVFHLKSFDDESFHDQWVGLVRPCVVLFDDFDAVFNGRNPCHETMELTFDCLLNILSGPGDLSHGILTVFTTNHPETFDPALASPAFGRKEADAVSRPGRIDRVLELGFISIEEAEKIVKVVTRDDHESTAEAMRILVESELGRLTPISALETARSVVQSKLTFINSKDPS